MPDVAGGFEGSHHEQMQLFGTMWPMATSAGIVELQELEELGVDFGDDAKPAYVLFKFRGDVYGLPETLGADVENKILFTAENAALIAAILIGQAEQIIGRIRFAAMLDQELAHVRENTPKRKL